jgi:hypothetical protein
VGGVLQRPVNFFERFQQEIEELLQLRDFLEKILRLGGCAALGEKGGLNHIVYTMHIMLV